MDRKSIIVVIVSVVFIVLWFPLTNKIWPPVPRKAPTNAIQSATAAFTNTAGVAATPPTNATTAAASTNATVTEAAQPEKLLSFDTAEARYTFTSHGGGMNLIELKEYLARVGCRDGSRNTNEFASLNTHAPIPVMALTSLDQFRSDDIYDVTTTGSMVRSERTFPSGLHVTKEFKSESNHLVAVTISFENRSAAPLVVPSHEWAVGTSTPSSSDEDIANRGIYWYNGSKAEHVDASWFANRTLGCFSGTPRVVYVAGLTNVRWAAVHSQFFALALAPREAASQVLVREINLPPLRMPGNPPESTNSSVSAWLFTTNDLKRPTDFAAKLRSPPTAFAAYLAERLSPESRLDLQASADGRALTNLQSLVNDLNRIVTQTSIYQDVRPFFSTFELSVRTRRLIDEQPRGPHVVRLNHILITEAFAADFKPLPIGYEAALSYAPLTLAPQQTVRREFHFYGGPREYNSLARIGARLGNDLDSIMGYGGFFGFFAKALLLSMNGLYALGLSYALAIIVITIIIKCLFWPLTNASTKSMKRMAALQPQMKALQEKYKEDPAKMNKKLMEFMKEHKVSPLGGCLPMLLQLPVFFGFFTMIRSAIELRGARFLWVCDLSKPDTLFAIPGLGWNFNLLPLIMGVTMLWQARLTPPSPGMDPTQQKIMRYMPLMFLAILYNFSAGLTLYWTVQNLLTIAQMKLTKARDDSATPTAGPSPARPQLKNKKK